MVVCASGSQPKPGAPQALLVTADYMFSVLPAGMEWMRPLLPYIKPVLIDSMATFCASEPPGLPDLTGLVVQAVLAGGQVGAAFTATQALTQVVSNYLWYAYCQCISGGTPAAPAAPAPPAVLPVVNPPALAPLNNTACDHVYATATGNVPFTNWNELIGTTGSHNGIAPFFPRVLPSGVTTAVITMKNNASGTPNPYRFNINFLDNSRNSSGQYNHVASGPFYDVASGATLVVTVAVPAGVVAVEAGGTFQGSVASANVLELTIDSYCGVAPGGPITPCCPPDPTLTGMVLQTLELVRLIQRQAAPFSYVYGANHAALSGHGSFTVADLIGVSVDVTTLPTSYGQRDGTPVELFDIGYVTLGTADGYQKSQRIDHDGLLWMPPAAGVFTSVAYTLSPGIVVAIRELVRES